MKPEIIEVDIDSLKPFIKNPRINEAAIESVQKSIEKFGYNQYIVVDQNLRICVGHTRYYALKNLGYKTIKVFQKDMTEKEFLAYNIADNKTHEKSTWDSELLVENLLELKDDDLIKFTGFDDSELNDLFGIEEDPEADKVPETLQNESGVKLGDIYNLGEHRLMCGDSTDQDTVKTLMDGENIDLVFTDPPYGIDEETDRDFASRTRKTKGGVFPKILGDLSTNVGLNAYSVCEKLTNIICFWGGNYFADKLLPSSCWIVWDKRVEENQRDMNSDCELAYVKHPTKKSVRIFRHLWKGMIKSGENSKRVHPTQKPIALAEWSLNELAPESKKVLDLFGGSGSTLIACEKTNRKCFMMELDPHYCSVIIKRWETYTDQKAVKI